MSKGGDTHEMVITNTAFPPICFSNLLFKKLKWALIKGERVVESKNKNIDLETSTGTLPKTWCAVLCKSLNSLYFASETWAIVLQAFQSFPLNISSFQCSPFNCNGLRGTVAVKKLKEGKEGKRWGGKSWGMPNYWKSMATGLMDCRIHWTFFGKFCILESCQN